MNNHRISTNFAGLKTFRQKSTPCIPLIAHQRKQIAGMKGMRDGTVGQVQMAAGNGKRVLCSPGTGRAIMDMHSEKSIRRQSGDFRNNHRSAGDGKKGNGALQIRIFFRTAYFGCCGRTGRQTPKRKTLHLNPNFLSLNPLLLFYA